MISKAQKIRLGIFFIITSCMLISFILILIGNTILQKRDFYYINYQNVSVNGLQLGSSVKYYGINVGRVEDVTFDNKDVNNVIVEISLDEGTPIKSDVAATLVSVGITGLKQIEITGGTNESQVLQPNSNITPGKSSMAAITGKAEIIADKTEMLINNLNTFTNAKNLKQIQLILTNTDSLITTLNNILKENQPRIASVVANIDSTTDKLLAFSKKADQSIAQIQKIISSKEIELLITNLVVFSDSLQNMNLNKIVKQDFNLVLDNFNETLSLIQNSVKHIDLTVIKGRGDFLTTLEDLRETASYLNDFSRQITEDPSILIRSKNK